MHLLFLVARILITYQYAILSLLFHEALALHHYLAPHRSIHPRHLPLIRSYLEVELLLVLSTQSHDYLEKNVLIPMHSFGLTPMLGLVISSHQMYTLHPDESFLVF